MKKINYGNLIYLITNINDSMDYELENLYPYKKAKLDNQENKISELFMHKILFLFMVVFTKTLKKIFLNLILKLENMVL